MKLEHQADPALGVMHWQEVMRSVSPRQIVVRPNENRSVECTVLGSVPVTVPASTYARAGATNGPLEARKTIRSRRVRGPSISPLRPRDLIAYHCLLRSTLHVRSLIVSSVNIENRGSTSTSIPIGGFGLVLVALVVTLLSARPVACAPSCATITTARRFRPPL